MRQYVIQLYRGNFEHLRDLICDNGDLLLDINNSTHKYILQYLFLTRINESLMEWKSTWNNHKLRLPHGQQYIDTATGTVKRYIVPMQVMDLCDTNFGQFDNIDMLRNPYVHQNLFEEDVDDDDDDDDDAGIQFTTAAFELGEDKFVILQQYEPLNLTNSVEECINRYIECIMHVYK